MPPFSTPYHLIGSLNSLPKEIVLIFERKINPSRLLVFLRRANPHPCRPIFREPFVFRPACRIFLKNVFQPFVVWLPRAHIVKSNASLANLCNCDVGDRLNLLEDWMIILLTRNGHAIHTIIRHTSFFVEFYF